MRSQSSVFLVSLLLLFSFQSELPRSHWYRPAVRLLSALHKRRNGAYTGWPKKGSYRTSPYLR